MKSWGSSTINYKKDATSNEQHCEVDNDYVNLHDIRTGLHSSVVSQSKRSSSMSNTGYRFHIKCDRRLHETRYSVY